MPIPSTRLLLRWLAVTVISVTALARGAAAAPGLVVVGGGAPAETKTTVEVALMQATLMAGWSAPPDPLSDADGATVLRCVDSTDPWGCLPSSLESRGIERVLVVQVDRGAEGSDSTLALVGKLIARNPDSVVVRQRYCEACTDDKLAGASAELATQMIRELAVRSGKTMIAVHSEPPGAQILLDGERLGATNGTFRTYPGKHVVVFEKPDYEPQTREIHAKEGTTVEVAVTMRRASSQGVPGAPRRSRVVPALVTGAGIIALGAGVVWQATKDAPPLGELQPARIYSAPGIGLAVAGGVVTGLGAYLWWRAAKAPSSTPTVSLVEGGGLVGWSRNY